MWKEIRRLILGTVDKTKRCLSLQFKGRLWVTETQVIIRMQSYDRELQRHSAVKHYSAESSLVHFENKTIYFSTSKTL
jgi:hypothetical protein